MMWFMENRNQLAVGSRQWAVCSIADYCKLQIADCKLFSQGVMLLLLLFLPFISIAQNFPPPPSTPVVDYTGTLTNEQLAMLTNKIIRFEDSTSTQFAVAIMKTIGDYDVNEYAAKLGEYWGVGQKGKNNGVLIVLAMDVHHVGIQVGRGLEGAITDAVSGEVIRREMVPEFKRGDYYAGIDHALTTMMKLASGEFKADQYFGNRNQNPPFFFFFIILVIIGIIIFSRVVSVRRYARMNGVTFLAAWMLMNAAARRSRGSWGNFTGGGGFGGGFGGGGGGFGGGSFGGGGASGSW